MPQVKHYGCFQFKDGTPEDQIANCFNSMEGMVGKIPGLLDFHYGPPMIRTKASTTVSPMGSS
jgi:hypothetical protein